MNEELCTEKGGLWTNAIEKGEDVFYCDVKENLESDSDEKLENIAAVKPLFLSALKVKTAQPILKS